MWQQDARRHLTHLLLLLDAGEHKQLFLQDVTLLEDRSELNTDFQTLWTGFYPLQAGMQPSKGLCYLNGVWDGVTGIVKYTFQDSCLHIKTIKTVSVLL